MITLVTFDLDGVFFLKPHNNFAESYAKRFNLDLDFVKDVLFNRSEIEGGYRNLKLGKKSDYFEWEFKTLGIEGEFTVEQRMDMLLEGYKINQEVLDFIKELHSQNIKVGTISNRYKLNSDYLEKEFQFKKYFDFIILSHDVGILKPDKEIFQVLLDKSNVRPEEILYSDDDEGKIQGAKELGINTYIFTSLEKFKKDNAKLLNMN